MSETRHWLISGRVQGVFFRESTRREAEALGLRGYAVNLPDGRVEVAASGADEALDALEKWLHDGPPAAQVTAVEAAPGQARDLPATGFRTG